MMSTRTHTRLFQCSLVGCTIVLPIAEAVWDHDQRYCSERHAHIARVRRDSHDLLHIEQDLLGFYEEGEE
jgi:hypothetical protein